MAYYNARNGSDELTYDGIEQFVWKTKTHRNILDQERGFIEEVWWARQWNKPVLHLCRLSIATTVRYIPVRMVEKNFEDKTTFSCGRNPPENCFTCNIRISLVFSKLWHLVQRCLETIRFSRVQGKNITHISTWLHTRKFFCTIIAD